MFNIYAKKRFFPYLSPCYPKGIILTKLILAGLIISNVIFAQSDFYLKIELLSDSIITNRKIILKDDVVKADLLNSQALDLCSNEVSESLLLSTFCTLPYRQIPIKIPLLGISYRIPLPTVSEGKFKEVVSSVPANLFFDTDIHSLDRDKLTHFFGNAFLSYNFPRFNFSKFMGILIELFEESFVSSGEFDLRDMMVNALGAWFGFELHNNPRLQPSSILRQYSLLYFRFY